jgi:hypothetical protein
VARFNFTEVKDLARDLGKAERVVGRQAGSVVKDAAQRVARDWRENAKDTAGSHGKLYPHTIGFELGRFALAALDFCYGNLRIHIGR